MTPAVLVWARETVGLTAADAAATLDVTVETLASWEGGLARPTVAKLRLIAKLYKRPVALFFLPAPPKDFDPIKDFRRVVPGEPARMSRDLRLGLRQVHTWRELSLELLTELGDKFTSFELTARLDSDPSKLAAQLRAALGVSLIEQLGWKDRYQALNAWRGAIERQGVLVFQVSGVAVGEMRGFSISAPSLPVIAVNQADAVNGRIFSLLHELAHLALHSGGLCNFEESSRPGDDEETKEVFCNRVAGEVLVPAEALEAQASVATPRRKDAWGDAELASLGRRFCVSEEVIARRLLALGRVSETFYRRKRSEYAARPHHAPTGIVTPDKRVVAAAGKPFIRLVLEALSRDLITASDVPDYLGVRTKHLGKIEEAVFGIAGARGA